MRTRAFVLAGIIWLAVAGASAAEWPAKPVQFIVPFAAGGAADIIGRLFADSLSGVFNQQFIVEDRTGAGGLIGAQSVARSDPDGYTLMGAGMSSHVLAPATSKNPGFDPIADFTHIAFFGGAPSVILVHPSLGVTTFKDLLAHAHTRASIEYVSAGTGTVGNVLTEYIAAKEKIRLVHVPYRSGNAAVLDLLAGRVKVGTLNWSTAREHIAVGSLIAVGVRRRGGCRRLPICRPSASSAIRTWSRPHGTCCPDLRACPRTSWARSIVRSCGSWIGRRCASISRSTRSRPG